jgi:hypothetical protein
MLRSLRACLIEMIGDLGSPTCSLGPTMWRIQVKGCGSLLSNTNLSFVWYSWFLGTKLQSSVLCDRHKVSVLCNLACLNWMVKEKESRTVPSGNPFMIFQMLARNVSVVDGYILLKLYIKTLIVYIFWSMYCNRLNYSSYKKNFLYSSVAIKLLLF